MQLLSRHRLVTNEDDAMDLYADPTTLQKQLITLYGIKPSQYGR